MSWIYIFITLFILGLLGIVIFLIVKYKREQLNVQDQNEFTTGFISTSTITTPTTPTVTSATEKKEINQSDKQTTKPPEETVEDTGLTIDEFFGIFFPDPTKNTKNALEFADSLADTVKIGRFLYKNTDAILKFFNYVSTKSGAKSFAKYVGTKTKNGAKLTFGIFKSFKNSKLVLKGSKAVRSTMMFKSLSKFLGSVKKFFLKMGIAFKGVLARLGVKAASYASRAATRAASTSLVKGSVKTAKMIQSGAKTTVNTIKTIKTIATASKAGVTVAKVGAKMSFMAAKLSNPIGWATMVFDITNIILDVANVGGYSDIGYKSDFYTIRDDFIKEINEFYLQGGYMYPFIYGPKIDEEKIYENIQARIALSFENAKDDPNDLTYKMRKQIITDLESGVLTFDMLSEDSTITKYYNLVDSEKLFRDEYDSICLNSKGEIVEIDDRFSLYDKTDKKIYNKTIKDDYFYTEGKDIDGQSIKEAETDKTRAECEEFCNTVEGCNGIVTYTKDKNTKGKCRAVKSVDYKPYSKDETNPYSKDGSAIAKRLPNSVFAESLQLCEHLFSEKSKNDNSYLGFSYRDYDIYTEFIYFNKLNDNSFIGILEIDKMMYKKKSVEHPLEFVDMSLKGLEIKMSKVIQLKDNSYIGISNNNLYTCKEFNEDAVWSGPVITKDKIISICELDNGEFLVIKDDFLLYSKKTLTFDAVPIKYSSSSAGKLSDAFSIQMISITKNNDGTFLIIGKDNFIYTQKDLNSPQVSTTLGSVVHGFQANDGIYIFVGIDFKLYFKTDLTDLLLDPYEQMDFNCLFLKDSDKNNLKDDNDTAVYMKNNKPIQKLKVCGYKEKNCVAKWPIPENDEDYLYHEYRNNILGKGKGACVLTDARMRQYCESDEVKNKYPEFLKTKTYDMDSHSCLINRQYCSNRGVDYKMNDDLKEYDCATSPGQDVLEFLFGTTTTRAIQAGINKGANSIVQLVLGNATSIICPEGQTRRGEFCYENCPSDYSSDGTHTCYKNKPNNWKGSETLTHLQHDTIYSTVGGDGSKSIPNGCKNGENRAGLCYVNPDPSQYEYSSPGIFKGKCPVGYDRWDGTGCWNDADTFGITAYGKWWYESWDDVMKRCQDKERVNCEWVGALAYPKCVDRARSWSRKDADKFYNTGWGTCQKDPRVHYPGLKSVIGTPLDKCPTSDREKVGGLCYPKCPDGYERRGDNVEMCSTKCPNTSDYFYTEGKDIDGQTIRKSETTKTRAECEEFCNTVDGCNGIVTYTKDKNTKGECWAVRNVDNPYSKYGSAVAKRVTYTNIGIGGCQKPSKWVNNTGYIYDVGICPPNFPVKVDALCYKDSSMAI
jgi:cytoskeletal protein RodZ